MELHPTPGGGEASAAGLYLATIATTALLLLSTPGVALASSLRVGGKASTWARVEGAAFSGLGWTLWSLALVAVARGLAAPLGSPLPASWIDAVADPARELALTGAAAAATGGALFMACAAVAAATGRVGGGRRGRGAAAGGATTGVARPPPHARALLFSPATGSALIAALGCGWAAAAAAFLLAAPSLTCPAARGVYLAAAAACLAAGAGTTHGFGGRLRARALAAPAAAWRFVQPGRGGPAFVAAQAGAWGLTGCAGAGLLALARLAPGGRALAAGAAATAAAAAVGQVLIAASLLVWRFETEKKKENKADAGAKAAAAAAAPPAAQADGPLWWLPLLILYAPIHALLAVVAASFLLLPVAPSLTAAAWAVGTAAAYACTARGDPARTGCREWPAFQAWLARAAFPALARVGCPVAVVHDDPAASAALMSGRCGGGGVSGGGVSGGGGVRGRGHPVFSVAPHGLYPISMILLSLHPALRELAAGGGGEGGRRRRGGGGGGGGGREDHAPPPRPAVLAANAVLRAPVIRDLAAWAGVRSASRATAASTLAARPILLMPGGQAELVHTWRLAARRELVLVRGRRKGFVRLAVEAGSPLVPVLVVGETALHSELVHAPALKAATVARLGFPFPFCPVGRWGGPLPKPGPLTFVIGRPVWPVQAPGAAADDVAAAVAATHAAYFSELEGLVERHAGPGVKLVWQDD